MDILAREKTFEIALTDAATINTDAASGNVFTVTLGGNRTLANPTNAHGGQTLRFRFKQDATGGRTLTLGTKFAVPSGATLQLSTAANAVDYMTASYDAARDKFDVVAFIKGF